MRIEDESDETRTSIKKPSESNPPPAQIENSKFWEQQESEGTWILNSPEHFKYMFCVFLNESLYLFWLSHLRPSQFPQPTYSWMLVGGRNPLRRPNLDLSVFSVDTIFVLDSNYLPNPVVTMHFRRGIWLPSKFAPLKHQGFHSTNQLSWASGFGKLTMSYSPKISTWIVLQL